MSIRSSALPPRWDLSPGFQDILRRNGLQAHIVENAGKLKLLVKGHDSPFLSYEISHDQLRALTDWGTNSANKKAYNTLAGLIGNDFYLPRSYVHAQHANCSVVMGLHGYRLNREEAYHHGYSGRHYALPIFGRGILGWTPRNQPGYHLARPDGALFRGGVMVPDRVGGYMKPGELQSGTYGFYYKGQSNPPAKQEQFDVLAELETIVKAQPPQQVPAPKREDGKAYNELITSPVYFSNEKFQECLASHGIVISTENKSLTIQSEGSTHDFNYQLTEEEFNTLTNNSLKEVPLQNRLDMINNIIKDDFAQPITMDMLNSKSVLSITLHPEVAEGLEREEQKNAQFAEEYDNYLKGTFLDPNAMSAEQESESKRTRPETEVETEVREKKEPSFVERYNSSRPEGVKAAILMEGSALQSIDASKGWYREGKGGREVQVGGIAAEKFRNGKYCLMAEIDGERVVKEISEKQYDKFASLDDYHRLKMVSKVFDEMDLKKRPDNPEKEQKADRQNQNDFERFAQKYTSRDVEESIAMNGNTLQALNENKAWYREIENGREVQVDDIMAHKFKDGKCCLTAVIDGKHVTHEISSKQYDKFAALDDYHRLKMVSKVFGEMDMKTKPGRGFNLLAAITAGIAVAGEVAGAVHHARHRPEIYESHYHGPAPRVLYKPGVDTPESIAARAFDMGRNSVDHDCHRGR